MGFTWPPDHKREIHCPINLLLFIKAVGSAEPGGRGTLWVSHLSKQEEDQVLEYKLRTNYREINYVTVMR